MKYRDVKQFGRLGDYVLDMLEWILYAGLIGASVGVIGVAFELSLSIATALRETYDWLIFFMPVAGMIIVLLYRGWLVDDPKGTNRIIKAAKGDREGVALRIVPLIFISTVLTHLTGGSSGREGAALQIGGSMASWIGRRIKLKYLDLRILVQCGMAAGFSALFGAPIAAAVFAMEVVSSDLHYYGLFPCFLSAVIAKVTATALGGQATHFIVFEVPDADLATVIRVIVMGLLVALLSIAFIQMLHVSEKLYSKYFKNPYFRAAVGGCIVVALTMLSGTRDYNGAGLYVIVQALAGNAAPLAFFWKMLFTALTLSAGYKGGEIVPTLFIGATFGAVAAPLIGLGAQFGAGIGMIMMFCAVTNCPIASLFLAFELLAGRGLMLCALGCSVAYMMSGRYSLYREQRLSTGKFSFEVAADSADVTGMEDEDGEKAFPDAPDLPDDEDIREEVGIPEGARRTEFNLYSDPSDEITENDRPDPEVCYNESAIANVVETQKGRNQTMKYVCEVCGYVYNEATGDPEHGIAPGTKWEDLPADFECPVCTVGKDQFKPE